MESVSQKSFLYRGTLVDIESIEAVALTLSSEKRHDLRNAVTVLAYVAESLHRDVVKPVFDELVERGIARCDAILANSASSKQGQLA